MNFLVHFRYFGGGGDRAPHSLLQKVVIITAQRIPWSQICIEEYEKPIWASVKIVADDVNKISLNYTDLDKRGQFEGLEECMKV